jgi:hypothetical protein
MSSPSFQHFFLMGLALCMVFLSGVSLASEPKGSVRGMVEFCGQGGVEGMRVYVPGRQNIVITADDGKFFLEGVPAGVQAIAFAMAGQVVNRKPDVTVLEDETTELGKVVFCDSRLAAASEPAEKPVDRCEENSQSPECADADKDGVIAAKDCDDNNPKIFPGAFEACDGIDNNCNGVVDDNNAISIPNGFGKCEGGKVVLSRCAKHFSDCDGKIENGCEIDLYHDSENCGSCGNMCPADMQCGLGFC